MPKQLITAHIDNLSHDGRGVARINGKATFIEDALPGEDVTIEYVCKHSQRDEAKALEIIKASKDRVVPKCRHFGICGGCSLQHLAHHAQLQHKQKILLEQLQRIAGLIPAELMPPVEGPIWNYRRRARLGAKFVAKKNKILVGFHERNGRYITDMQSCPILDPAIGEKLLVLADLIQSLSIYNQIPQLEIACGDKTAALVFRCLTPPTETDLAKLRTCSAENSWQIHLQKAGPDSIELLCDPAGQKLSYKLAKNGVELFFAPMHFVQINAEINAKMAGLILELLAPEAHETLLDLFCGLGNFTLPLARNCRQIIGIEGNSPLVDAARANAVCNSISNAVFYAADLASDLSNAVWLQNKFDKILLDPPRTGAFEICKFLPALGAEKILYISCNPITLARDSKELTAGGYHLTKAGVLDMFPHTSHVEAAALFVRQCSAR